MGGLVTRNRKGIGYCGIHCKSNVRHFPGGFHLDDKLGGSTSAQIQFHILAGKLQQGNGREYMRIPSASQSQTDPDKH